MAHHQLGGNQGWIRGEAHCKLKRDSSPLSWTSGGCCIGTDVKRLNRIRSM